MKTIHVDADKHRKEIGEAYVVLSGSSKAQFLLIVWLAVGRLIRHIYVATSYWYLQVLRDYVLRQLCADSILLNATKKFTKEAVAFD
nr:hypothetical protein [Tanacetum cinerariifolium]